MAASTFVQEVLCVRIAPTITSNRERPGHQCCGPCASNSVRKYAVKGRASGRKGALTGRNSVPETLLVTGKFSWTEFGKRRRDAIPSLKIATARRLVKKRRSTKALLPIRDCPFVQVLASSERRDNFWQQESQDFVNLSAGSLFYLECRGCLSA